MKRFIASIACAIALMAHADQYGVQLYGNGAFLAQRVAPSGESLVGTTSNAWGFIGSGTVFGAVSEAVSLGSTGYLVGNESAVVNLNPANAETKVAYNAVFKCRKDGAAACSGLNNTHSTGLWVSAEHETGFESAIRLDRWSIHDSPERHATVIDTGDLDPSANYVFIRLPGGREVRYSELIHALDACNQR